MFCDGNTLFELLFYYFWTVEFPEINSTFSRILKTVNLTIFRERKKLHDLLKGVWFTRDLCLTCFKNRIFKVMVCCISGTDGKCAEFISYCIKWPVYFIFTHFPHILLRLSYVHLLILHICAHKMNCLKCKLKQTWYLTYASNCSQTSLRFVWKNSTPMLYLTWYIFKMIQLCVCVFLFFLQEMEKENEMEKGIIWYRQIIFFFMKQQANIKIHMKLLKIRQLRWQN